MEAYSAPTNPLAGGDGLATPPREPHPRSRPFGPRLSYTTPKLVPTPLPGVNFSGHNRVHDLIIYSLLSELSWLLDAL